VARHLRRNNEPGLLERRTHEKGDEVENLRRGGQPVRAGGQPLDRVRLRRTDDVASTSVSAGVKVAAEKSTGGGPLETAGPGPVGEKPWRGTKPKRASGSATGAYPAAVQRTSSRCQTLKAGGRIQFDVE
jgi:hypothetical protein